MAEHLPHLEGLDHEEYQRLVQDLSRLDPIPIGVVVTGAYLFDFLVLFESLCESWSFYPFELHAFVFEDDVQDTLSKIGVDSIRIHRLSGESGDDWVDNAARKIRLVEESGLSRCLVSDADNVFLAETPELYVLLDRHDFVFVSAPHQGWVIQTCLWAFRRNDRSIAFARKWRSRSRRRGADASGLPFALVETRETDVEIKVLARPKPDESTYFVQSPYDVQANLTPFELHRDELGFWEAEMGRAKVLHLSGLLGRSRSSLQERLDLMVSAFPQCAPFLPLYVRLATRAAKRLGIPTPADPSAYLHDRMLDAGLLANRLELPALLNRRGLAGTGVHVGAQGDPLSDHIAKHWRGRLVPADPVTGDADGLDFVYFDPSCTGESLKQQLERWYPKVRRGGVLAGCSEPEANDGRMRPALETQSFFEDRGLRVKAAYADEQSLFWLVDIPSSEAERVESEVHILVGKIRGELEKARPRDRKSLQLWRAELEALTGKSFEDLMSTGVRIVR